MLCIITFGKYSYQLPHQHLHGRWWTFLLVSIGCYGLCQFSEFTDTSRLQNTTKKSDHDKSGDMKLNQDRSRQVSTDHPLSALSIGSMSVFLRRKLINSMTEKLWEIRNISSSERYNFLHIVWIMIIATRQLNKTETKIEQQ